MDEYGLECTQAIEFSYLVVEAKKQGFIYSKQLSGFIVQSNLKKKYPNISGVVKMKDGSIMNLGGKEMDLRGGGFVPIGKKERADDVPARLSKNEFVMTADAVRAAGGGNINEGARRMYETMNKLEARA